MFIVKKKLTIIMITFMIVIMSVLYLPKTAADDNKNIIRENNVYSFNMRRVSKLLSNLGYHDVNVDLNGHRVSRNADGTSIRIINGYTKSAVIFNCDGSVKYLNLPNHNSWLDNNGNIIAWPDNSKQNAVKHLRGRALPPIMAMDPSGQYLISCFNDEYLAIASVAKPDIPLAKVKVFYTNYLSLFAKGNKIYVFGRDDSDGYGKSPKAFIYEKDGDQFILTNEFEIPREKEAPTRYLVEDMSPLGDELLLYDGHDFPLPSNWYIYNLNTKELKYLGKAKDRGLFLQCDILEKVEQKLGR